MDAFELLRVTDKYRIVSYSINSLQKKRWPSWSKQHWSCCRHGWNARPKICSIEYSMTWGLMTLTSRIYSFKNRNFTDPASSCYPNICREYPSLIPGAPVSPRMPLSLLPLIFRSFPASFSARRQIRQLASRATLCLECTPPPPNCANYSSRFFDNSLINPSISSPGRKEWSLVGVFGEWLPVEETGSRLTSLSKVPNYNLNKMCLSYYF